jgi:CheY-like chemotaxis protein
MPAEYQILIVEDSPTQAEELRLILEERSYTVRCVANGREALKLLRGGERPRLILLDLLMPLMGGWQFRELQAKDPAFASIPVVVMSAADQVQEKAEALWAAAWLSKPIDADKLLAVVKRLC